MPWIIVDGGSRSGYLMTTVDVSGECFFWYRLTRVVADKIQRAVKRLCVCVFWATVASVCIDTNTLLLLLLLILILILIQLFYRSLNFVWTAWVSRYLKGKTNLDFLEQATMSGSGISWAICKSTKSTLPQIDNHAITPSLSFLQAGCPSCRPTNSVKALKAQYFYYASLAMTFICRLR